MTGKAAKGSPQSGGARRKPSVAAGGGPKTAGAYIAGLPDGRRKAISTLRRLILKNLPKGYAESVELGMISYGVPLETYPDTYNGRPLCYVALASQKNHIALYAMSLYSDPDREIQFRDEFRKAGKKLNMGKSCIRFKSLDDLPLPVIARLISGTTVKEFIAMYEKGRG